MLDDFYEGKDDTKIPFPMHEIANKEWGEKVLKQMMWEAEIPLK